MEITERDRVESIERSKAEAERFEHNQAELLAIKAQVAELLRHFDPQAHALDMRAVATLAAR
eukprot:9603448-Heterocapsa_arctica.AAC.1